MTYPHHIDDGGAPQGTVEVGRVLQMGDPIPSHLMLAPAYPKRPRCDSSDSESE